MKKLLLILGLVVLLVTPLRAEEEDDEEAMEEEEEEMDDEGGEEEDSHGGDEGDRDEDYVTKGEYVKTDGEKKHCESHSDCYDQREPQQWCRLKAGEEWTDRGCYCEDSQHACVIERKKGGKLQYTYCASEEGWQCA